MVYSKGCHTVFYHRYHVVWATKYRYDVLRGELRLRIRDIIRQTCEELGIEIIKGVLSRDHVHMFLAIPPQHSVSDVMRRIKGRSSRKIQQGFRASANATGAVISGRGAISRPQPGTSPDTILQYLAQHIRPTGVSR
ncbi:MAG: IS200/IS605 family transposase [Geminicoccaceae bacterium]